ncbi:MAG TPA: EAL domain-containing protein [Rhodocyclaceae bacterium]|nr:EAL domain-containing protein [Rhodocyclaceae bacterium]
MTPAAMESLGPSVEPPQLGFTADLVAQLVVPTFALDAHRRVILWNTGCERLTGMPAARVLGTRDHWRAFYDEDRPCLADLLVEGRAGEIDAYYPIHHHSEDAAFGAHTENWCVMPLLGKRLYLAIDAGPIRDETGRLVAVVETLRDMTERQNAEVRLRAMFDHSPDMAMITERQTGRFLQVNGAFTRVLGHTPAQAIGRTSTELGTWATPTGRSEVLAALGDAKRLANHEVLLRRADGSVFPALISMEPLTLDGIEVLFITARDISDRKRAEEAIRLYANVFEHSGEAILVTDRDNRIVSLNRTFTRLTGYTLDDLRGRNPSVLASGNTPPDTYQAMWKAVQLEGFWQGELWDRAKDGNESPRWAAISSIRDDEGELTHYIASFTDITEHKAAADRIEYLAHHDALTGLCNRFCLEGRLAQSLLEAKREQRTLAVMFIDLDRFKVINDALGHHVGDLLLVQVAERLQSCMRESDIVSRLGGDEFVVVSTRLVDAADAGLVAARILNALDVPYTLEGRVLHATPSIGVSVFPDNGDDPATLMKCADAAMYSAKEKGRNGFQFFTATMTAAATERLELERDLRAALQEGQFELHYQPQISTADGRTRGMEALLRWRHPRRGMVSPMTFIPIAEETGVIIPLGLWVLDEACRQLAAWRADGIVDLRVAVNLSAQQLRSPDLIDDVRNTLAKHGLGAGDLELEVTETTAMTDPERAIGQLKALRDLGVDLAIDDFGTGYSSLAYLKLLPIQTLKLDRAFVCDIETDDNDAAISGATVALAHSLDLRVVAEGIETEGQGAFLRHHGCDMLQGYLYGRPEPGTAWSERWRKSG